jgi:hypothetical protein
MKVNNHMRFYIVPEHPTVLLSHRGEKASLRQKLDDINEAIEPLVSGKCGNQ